MQSKTHRGTLRHDHIHRLHNRHVDSRYALDGQTGKALEEAVTISRAVCYSLSCLASAILRYTSISDGEGIVKTRENTPLGSNELRETSIFRIFDRRRPLNFCFGNFWKTPLGIF